MKILIIGDDTGSVSGRGRPVLIEPAEYSRVLDTDASLHTDRVGKNIDDIMAINATGLSCSGTLLHLFKAIKMLKQGESLVIAASDPVFFDEVAVWCRQTGNILRHRESSDDFVTAVVQKRTKRRARLH